MQVACNLMLKCLYLGLKGLDFPQGVNFYNNLSLDLVQKFKNERGYEKWLN